MEKEVIKKIFNSKNNLIIFIENNLTILYIYLITLFWKLKFIF